jgi:hypothetical protein
MQSREDGDSQEKGDQQLTPTHLMFSSLGNGAEVTGTHNSVRSCHNGKDDKQTVEGVVLSGNVRVPPNQYTCVTVHVTGFNLWKQINETESFNYTYVTHMLPIWSRETPVLNAF